MKIHRAGFASLPVLLVAISALVLSACGSDDAGDGVTPDSSTTTTTTEASTVPGSSPGGGKSVAITADPSGGLAYEQADVAAAAGTVEIAFDNPSQVVHDVTIERDGSDVGATDRVTGASTSTKLDLDPGEYTFYCSITGHRGAGMEGTLVVE